MNINLKHISSFSLLKAYYIHFLKVEYFILFSILLLLNSCIVQFIPEISEDKELLVVQGLITDQPGANSIKLSRSLPFGERSAARPLSYCIVTISDDQGSSVRFSETASGSYVPPSFFRGVIGRSYTLHITVNSGSRMINYESDPMEMKPVPPIDSIYYKKIVVKEPFENLFGIDACQIYLNTHDPQNNCKYYRWDFVETWVLRLLFPVENQTCWITENSHTVNIKSTAVFDEAIINTLPVTYITNVTDRLKRKYSILVNQYSLSEEEYNYWQKIQNVTDQVGGLYDIIPSSIPGNIRCMGNPEESVLGYFSVSAKSSERIFIKDEFAGIIDRYNKCVTDTIPYVDPPGLNISVWILDDEPYTVPPYRILTDDKGCADCTVRGSNVKPDFWIDDK